MIFSAKKDDLTKVLGPAQSLAEKRSSIPVLANVKIIANASGQLDLIATDMDICMQMRINAAVKKDFSTTIPANTLYEIVRKVQDNSDVNFSIEDELGESIVITADKSRFVLPVISADEFPNIENITDARSFSIPSETLKILLSKTRHAISVDETRYYLNGVYFHEYTSENGEKFLRMVSTDGHRLALGQSILPSGAEGMEGAIIPKKAIAEILKLLDGFTGLIEIQLSNKKISFKIGDAVITSKLISGKFPDYEQVIPNNNDKFLQIQKDILSKSIDLVISVSSDKTRSVKLSLAPNKVILSASSDINSYAQGRNEIDATFQGADTLTVGYNSRYLLDALSAITSNNVAMSFSSSLGASIVKDMDDENFLYILMPMQV